MKTWTKVAMVVGVKILVMKWNISPVVAGLLVGRAWLTSRRPPSSHQSGDARRWQTAPAAAGWQWPSRP